VPQLSQTLYDFLGGSDELLPRAEVTKRIWAYVKEHDLKDPKDGRKALCDEALQKVFKCKSFTFFSLSKKLSPHLKDCADLVSHPTPSAPKAKKPKKESLSYKVNADGEQKSKSISAKGAKSASKKGPKMRPLTPELAAVCGTDRLQYFHVTKHVWAYIREHNLQNPANKKQILCDPLLEKVMKTKKVDCFKMAKLLQPHILPPDE